MPDACTALTDCWRAPQHEAGKHQASSIEGRPDASDSLAHRLSWMPVVIPDWPCRAPGRRQRGDGFRSRCLAPSKASGLSKDVAVTLMCWGRAVGDVARMLFLFLFFPLLSLALFQGLGQVGKLGQDSLFHQRRRSIRYGAQARSSPTVVLAALPSAATALACGRGVSGAKGARHGRTRSG